MQEYFPYIVALAVALAVWGAARLLVASLGGERRKLQQRIAAKEADASANPVAHSVMIEEEKQNFSTRLGQMGPFKSLSKNVTVAFEDLPFARFMGIVAGVFLLAYIIISTLMDANLAGFIGASLAAFVPIAVANSRAAKRQKVLTLQLPDALDFLTRVLRAGHSLSTGIQMMGQEINEPLAAEFRRCYDQHSLGIPLESALKQMTKRVTSGDFAFFVTSVLIQRQTGGDLSEVLTNISAMVRQRIRLQQHVKAITAEGRLTSYILVAFPAVLFCISYAMNPQYAGILLRDTTGQLMLGGSIGLQLLGLFVIRKIVTIKV